MKHQYLAINSTIYLARGGGGGSSSGGGGSSSSHSSSSSSYSRSATGKGSGGDLPWWGSMLIVFLSFGVPLIIIILIIPDIGGT